MFQLAWPAILLLLPLPLLIRWLVPAAKVKTGAALKVPFFTAITNLTKTSSWASLTIRLRPWVIYLIWALLVFAASGPRWLGKPIQLPRQGRDIMLAIDLSGSMQIPDMQLNHRRVDRLNIVKYIADEFISHRQGDQLGLILFGSRAYLQTPLTFDRKTVRTMLNDATIGLAGSQTAIGDAIGLAIKRLRKRPRQSRVLVLLTDGVNNSGHVSPLAAAKLAKQYGIRIYTIGIGADQMVLPTLLGNQVTNPSADLDEKTLKQIAKITGGMYFRAKNTRALARAYQQINQIEPVAAASTTIRNITPLYPWPLALALVLSIILMMTRVIRTYGLK